MSHGQIAFYEAINSPEKAFNIRFNPATPALVHNPSHQILVKDYPGICRGEVYRSMDAVIWFEYDIAAIASAETAKTPYTTGEKITQLQEIRKARQNEKTATVVEAHCVRYVAQKHVMEHHIQELTLTPLLQLRDNGPTLLRKELLGAVNLQDNGYVLIWLCDPLVSDPENNPPRFLINELFTAGGQPYFILPGEYRPVQSIRFYSLFSGKQLMSNAKVLPDNGHEVVDVQYSIVIGQDCPDPNKL